MPSSGWDSKRTDLISQESVIGVGEHRDPPPLGITSSAFKISKETKKQNKTKNNQPKNPAGKCETLGIVVDPGEEAQHSSLSPRAVCADLIQVPEYE